jgi:hypothetical protein
MEVSKEDRIKKGPENYLKKKYSLKGVRVKDLLKILTPLDPDLLVTHLGVLSGKHQPLIKILISKLPSLEEVVRLVFREEEDEDG